MTFEGFIKLGRESVGFWKVEWCGHVVKVMSEIRCLRSRRLNPRGG
jgi:hypothetical protein